MSSTDSFPSVRHHRLWNTLRMQCNTDKNLAAPSNDIVSFSDESNEPHIQNVTEITAMHLSASQGT